MLAGFVDQLARFSESTGTYHDRIGACAQRIAEASDIGSIGPLLDEVMLETRGMQDEAKRSRDELIATREQARAAEERITKLQEELDSLTADSEQCHEVECQLDLLGEDESEVLCTIGKVIDAFNKQSGFVPAKGCVAPSIG